MNRVEETCTSRLNVKFPSAFESVHENENKKLKLEKSIHKFRDSSLDSSKNCCRYKGFSSLFPIILILANAYIGLEYFAKYGMLINLVEYFEAFFKELFKIPSIIAVSGLVLLSLFSFGLEVLLSKGVLNDDLGIILIILSISLKIFEAPVVVYFINSILVSGFLILFHLILFLKLVSYHVENYSYRKRITTAAFKTQICNTSTKKGRAIIEDQDSNIIHYPDNINIKNFYYFLFAPTLCYELNFPREPAVRKTVLARRLIEVLFLLCVILSGFQQIFDPIARDYQDCHQVEYSVDYALLYIKIYIAGLFMILLMHYLIYHSWLNALGEIMRFGDRHFYDDWWNSCNIRYFWSSWNVTVNKWAVRYVHKPLLKRGFTKLQATATVFFISAIMHEYLFSVPLKSFHIRFFLLMLGQIPFVHYANKETTNQGQNLTVAIFVCFSVILLSGYLVQIPTSHALKNIIL